MLCSLPNELRPKYDLINHTYGAIMVFVGINDSKRWGLFQNFKELHRMGAAH